MKKNKIFLFIALAVTLMLSACVKTGQDSSSGDNTSSQTGETSASSQYEGKYPYMYIGDDGKVYNKPDLETRLNTMYDILNYNNYVEGKFVSNRRSDTDYNYMVFTIMTDDEKTYQFTYFDRGNAYREWDGIYYPCGLNDELVNSYVVRFTENEPVKVYYDGTFTGDVQNLIIKGITVESSQWILDNYINCITEELKNVNENSIITPDDAMIAVCEYLGLKNMRKYEFPDNHAADFYYNDERFVIIAGIETPPNCPDVRYYLLSSEYSGDISDFDSWFPGDAYIDSLSISMGDGLIIKF